jgi:hypothetical protein
VHARGVSERAVVTLRARRVPQPYHGRVTGRAITSAGDFASRSRPFRIPHAADHGPLSPLSAQGQFAFGTRRAFSPMMQATSDALYPWLRSAAVKVSVRRGLSRAGLSY